MKNKRVKLTVLFFLLGCVAAFAQNNSPVIDRNIKFLENYTAANPLEKVHLHLDRQLYFPGDTVWFKAYVVAGTRHRPSKLSGVLYVELLNPKDSVEKQLVLKLDTGLAHAEFVLANTAQPGKYRIRAYTNWMRNAGPAFFYHQVITVSGFSPGPVASSVPNPGVATTPAKIDLQFFPEGGTFINDVPSKVAFKAVDENGMGIDVQGTIVNDVGTQELTFSSQHLGMGSFKLQPQRGESYFAKVIAANGSKFTVPLPIARDTGFTLAVSGASADSLYVRIVDRHMPDSTFYVLAQSDGRYYISAGDKLTAKVFSMAIPKNIFQTGIVQITLFSQSGEPLNERLVFVQDPDQVDISLTPDKQVYAPGEAVKFSMEAKDPAGVPDAGSFSVAVIDETRTPINEMAESTILTDLLLKSELSGYIEAPNYYFANPTDQTKADLDLLMLTQGYHRFEWKKMLAGSQPEAKYQAENGLPAVSGTVTTPSGAPVEHAHVMLTATRSMFALDTLTDANGKFVFDNLNLPDTAKVVINARNGNGGRNVRITFDKVDYPRVTEDSMAGMFATSAGSSGQLARAYVAWKQDSLKNVIQLRGVTIKSSKIAPIHADYTTLLKYSTNLNGPGQADQVITDEQFGKCLTMIECLTWMTKGDVRWTDGVAYSTHKAIELIGPPVPMAVVLDGVIMDQGTAFAELSPSDVSSIEVLASPAYCAIYGEAAVGGVFIITTKHGGPSGYEVAAAPGLAAYSFRRYYKARQFYSPQYRVKPAALNTDYRKTIYWSPDLVTDAAGKTSFTYFNSGTAGNYRVVLEGIDKNGRLARKVFTYKVE